MSWLVFTFYWEIVQHTLTSGAWLINHKCIEIQRRKKVPINFFIYNLPHILELTGATISSWNIIILHNMFRHNITLKHSHSIYGFESGYMLTCFQLFLFTFWQKYFLKISTIIKNFVLWASDQYEVPNISFVL